MWQNENQSTISLNKVNKAAYGELCWCCCCCCCCCCCWNLLAPRKFWRNVIFRWRGGESVWHVRPVALASNSETSAGFWLHLCWGLDIASLAQMTLYFIFFLAPDLPKHSNKWRDLQLFSVSSANWLMYFNLPWDQGNTAFVVPSDLNAI